MNGFLHLTLNETGVPSAVLFSRSFSLFKTKQFILVIEQFLEGNRDLWWRSDAAALPYFHLRPATLSGFVLRPCQWAITCSGALFSLVCARPASYGGSAHVSCQWGRAGSRWLPTEEGVWKAVRATDGKAHMPPSPLSLPAVP